MAVIPEMVPGETTLPQQYNDQHTVVDALSIISFMSRPQLIVKDLNWNDTQEVGTNLLAVDTYVPNVNLTSMLKCKLDGITSFRATAVLRLQFQTQPFQCGRLIFGAIPMPTLIQPRNKYIRSHPSLLQSINHVQVDINKHTEISLRIPFISPFNSYNLIDGKYPWAELVLMVYSKLQDPQKMNVPIRIYSHFEDVELGTPCSSELGKVDRPITSNHITPPTTPEFRPDGFITEDGRCIGVSSVQGLVVQQSGRPNKQASAAQVNASRRTESSGLVQPLSKGAGVIYNAIGTAVPFLKPVTDVFAQLAGLGGQFIGNLFGWLGFSKPQTSYAGFNILPRPTEFFCNANGVDHSHVLSLDKMNAVDEFPGLAGTTFDEMDMNYITRIPQWIGSFSYKTKLDEGKALFSSYVSPNYFLPGFLRILSPDDVRGVVNVLEHQEKQPTILNYASSFFMYWTGSLTYTFRFMKTSFHSGRVRVSFHPFTNTVDRDRLDYVYNAIIDLRENSEVSLTIPYVSPQPWKKVQFLDPYIEDPVNRWEEYGPGVTGRIEVNPITPLICSNPQVSETIECVIEVRAGDDFQLMGPVRSGYYPFSTELSKPKDIVIQQSGVFALAGTQETRTAAIEGFQPLSITTSSLDIHRTDTQKLCAGETFSNFRTLLKRFAFMEKVSFKPKSETIQRRVQDYLQAPAMLKHNWYAYVDPTKPIAPQGVFSQFKFENQVSPVVSVGQMYTFYRGGLRLKIFCDKNPKLMSARLMNYADAMQRVGQGYQLLPQGVRRIAPYNSATAFEFTQQKGFAEFQIPFYSPVMIGIPSKFSEGSDFDKSSSLIDISATNEEEEITCNIAVAGADDLSFHGFLGVPPVISIRTINDFYEMPEGTITWNSTISLIDTTGMDVDPTYPIQLFTATTTPDDGWNNRRPDSKFSEWSNVTDKQIAFCILGGKGIGCVDPSL